MNENTVEIAMLDKTIELEALDRTEIDVPHQHLECCGNYLMGVAEIGRFTSYVSIRNRDDIYRGKVFKFCPWCGEKNKM